MPHHNVDIIPNATFNVGHPVVINVVVVVVVVVVCGAARQRDGPRSP